MALFEFIIGLGFLWILLILIGYVFWLFMLIHAIINRDVLWIILFIFSAFTGFLPGVLAVIYYFTQYR